MQQHRKFTKFNHFMPQNEILLQPKKSAFSKSLKVMKCFKYVICILLDTEYWTAKAWLKTRRKELFGHTASRPWRQYKFVILFKSLQHPYLWTNTGIYLSSKQILGIQGYSLNKSVDFTNFAAVNKLTIIFLYKSLPAY